MSSTGSRQKIEGKTIAIDGATLKDLDLVKCRLVFSGGELPNLINNKMQYTEFYFDGAAGRTVGFLKALAAEPMGRRIVTEMLGLTKPS
jgi:hypothetical protein